MISMGHPGSTGWHFLYLGIPMPKLKGDESTLLEQEFSDHHIGWLHLLSRIYDLQNLSHQFPA